MLVESKSKKVAVENISDVDIQEIERLRREIKKKSGFGHQKYEEQLFGIINRISHGKFLDKRNVNHVVNAMKVTRENFNISDNFEASLLEEQDGHSFFYYSINGNPYVGLNDGNKIVIFSPENKLLKRLLTKYVNSLSERQKQNMEGENRLQRVKNFLSGQEQELSSNYTSYDWGYIMLEIAKTFRPRFEQIADCIVDLDAKKVYFF